MRFETIGGAASAFWCDRDAGLYHPPYAIYRCLDCSLYYKSQVLTEEALAIYYDKLDFSPFDGDYGFPTDAALLRELRRLPRRSRVLDFGCSSGRILGALGTHYDRFGIEINAAAAEVARQRGISIIEAAALADQSAGRFDAIILSDVFEHLLEPTETMRLLASCLAPGGRFLIVTGLADAVTSPKFMAEHWYFRVGGHLQMLSRHHLKWLAHTVGLDIGSIKTMSHYRRNTLRRLRQRVQAAAYETSRLEPRTPLALLIRATPVLKRSLDWTNFPSTDQRADHVLAILHRQTYCLKSEGHTRVVT